MAKDKTKQKEKLNPLLWFFFAIVIPLAVAVTLTVIIFSAAGVDAIGWMKNTANNVPVLAKVVKTDQEKDQQRTEEKLKDAIASKDEKISSLTQEVSNLESTIDDLEQEIIKLENSNKKKNETEIQNDEQNERKPVETISSSFKDMDSEQAAQILENMKAELAVSILKNLKDDVRGSIFEAMDAQKAADLTQLYIESGQ
ncbi:MotE family protein [Virgibacillus kekensis]|uniref:MotE family protein n=1 Tax=Virgibacillus kekensis TaxID=202261 RepID=A0ABV9DFK9_9BACI